MTDLLAQMPAMPNPPEALAGAEVIAYVLADLAIILIAARIVGGVFAKLGQPRVVGEIIAGILIGPTVLGGQLAKGAVTALDKPAVDGSGLTNDLYPLQAFAFLNLIGLLTLIFFMFLVGLEVQQRFLRGKERQILVVAMAVLIVPVALGFLVGAILDEPGKWKVAVTDQGVAVSATTHALFLGAALAVTAFPVMARILQEKRQLASPMGGIGVGAAAVVTPLMFLVLAGASASAKGQGVSSTIAIKLVLAVGLVIVLFAVVRPLLNELIKRRFKAGAPLDGELFAMLLVGAVLTGLAADRIGIHSLNGGFLFGAAVPQVAGLGKAVIDRLQQFVVVFLIPIFLAVSGLQTDLTVLGTEHIVGILVFVAAMIAGKWFVGAGAAKAVGLNWQESNAIGVLMNCRGLMILVVALVGKQAGVITDPMQGAFVIGAIVTTLMTGPLVDVFLPAEEVEEERKKSVAGSIAGMPAMTGGPRILIAPGGPGLVPAALERAAQFGGAGGPPPQYLVAGLDGPLTDGDYVGAQITAADAEEDPSRWPAATAARLSAEGAASADSVVLQTPEPHGDLAELAKEWAASDAVVGNDADAAALEGAGIHVHRVGD